MNEIQDTIYFIDDIFSLNFETINEVQHIFKQFCLVIV